MKTFIYLIVGVVSITDLILASVFFIPPTVDIGEDGNVTYTCELPYRQDTFFITDKTAYLPISDTECFKCSNCTETGSGCAQLFGPCPAEEDLDDDEELLHPTPETTMESTGESTEETTEGTKETTGESTGTNIAETTGESTGKIIPFNGERTEKNTGETTGETTSETTEKSAENTENTDNNSKDQTTTPAFESTMNTEASTEPNNS